LLAGLLARSQHASGRSCDRHLDAGFLAFAQLKADAEIVPKFQVATALFSSSLTDLNLFKLSPVAAKAIKLFFFNIIQFEINSVNQNPAVPGSSHCL
jgi:hypothetical protein